VLGPRPRVRVRPKGADLGSDAEDAIFLASSYGLIPDDWQEDALDDWLIRGRRGWLSKTCGIAVSRQNGKNGIIEIRELYGMVVLGEKFLHTAHEVKTARKAFKRLKYFFGEQVNDPNAKFPELNALVVEIRSTNGQEAIVLSNGGSVEFVARSKGSGRGFTVDVLVCDEAQDLTDEELEALLPTISAAPLRNPQIIFAGTPPNPEKNQTGEVFTRVRTDADNGLDPHLAFTDYGVPDGPLDKIAFDDLDILRGCNPALVTGRLQLEVCRTERRRMSAAGYARERLGWWGNLTGAESTEGVFHGWTIQARPGIAIPSVQAIGLAVSFDRKWGSIGSAGFTDDGQTYLAAVRRDPGTAWLVTEAARIQDAHGCTVAIAESGPGSNLIPQLEEAGVILTIVGTDDSYDAAADLADGIATKTHVHGSYPELDAAVKVTMKRASGDRWTLERRRAVDDISMAEAAMVAAWAANNAESDALSVHTFAGLDKCDRCGDNPHNDPDGIHAYLCPTCREET
jgi:hypothetical protein